MIQSNAWNIDSIQYLKYWFNPIPRILVQSNTWNIDSIQNLEYWFNPILGILIQSNTSNIDAIQYSKYWCNPIRNIDAIFWNFYSIFLGRARPTGTRVTKHKRALKNMAGEEGFEFEVEFSKFLAEVDKNWNTFWEFWLRSCTRSRWSSWSNHWSASTNEPLLWPQKI